MPNHALMWSYHNLIAFPILAIHHGGNGFGSAHLLMVLIVAPYKNRRVIADTEIYCCDWTFVPTL